MDQPKHESLQHRERILEWSGRPSKVNEDILVTSPVTPENLVDAFRAVEDHDLHVGEVVMHPREWADARKTCGDALDIENTNHPLLFKLGYMGKLWGAYVSADRNAQPGVVLVIGERLVKAGDDMAKVVGEDCIVRILVDRET